MSPLFVSRALLFAGECFAASALLMCVGWAASSFLKQASARHLVWLTAFGVSLVLPLAALIVPPTIVVAHRIAAPKETVAVPVYIESDPALALASAPAAAPPPAPRFVMPELNARNAAIALFALWLAGFGWSMTRLAAGMLGLRTLKRRSRPHALCASDLPALAAERRECELRLSSSDDGPLTWGIFRPVVLLPQSACRWPRARLQAVLLHELAHVRRRDSLTQLLSLIVVALYWPNPLVWLGARALRREAEIAADDAVLMLGIRPSDYAGALLRVAGEFHGHAVALSGVAMASGSALEARVKSVLSPSQSRRGVTSMDVLKTASLGLALTAVLAFARPGIVEAQDVSPATPAAAPSAPTPPDAVDAVTPEPPEAPADVAPLPAAPPVPPIRPVAHARHVHTVVHIHRDGRGDRVIEVNVPDQGEIDRQVADAQEQARRAEIAIASIEPEIERAIASAKIDEKVARALEDAHVSEKVAQALAHARAQLERDRHHMARKMVRIQRDHSEHAEIDDETPDAADSDDDDDKDDEGSPE